MTDIIFSAKELRSGVAQKIRILLEMRIKNYSESNEHLIDLEKTNAIRGGIREDRILLKILNEPVSTRDEQRRGTPNA